MRFNVWQRAGIVASVLWVVGGGFYDYRQQDKAAIHAALDPCYPKGEDFPVTLHCGAALYDQMLRDAWGHVAAFVFIPALLAWLLAYVMIWAARWVWAGRRPPRP